MERIFEFDYYFSDQQILRILCKKRALAAKKTHDSHFLRNISSSVKDPNRRSKPFIYSLFPSRSKWIRFKLNERVKRNANAVELNAMQLERTVRHAIKKRNLDASKNPEWLNRLIKFIEEIRLAALDPTMSYNIPRPKITPVPKEIPNVKNEYRPISSFELMDLIVVGQVAKYLTNCFDQLMYDCSYAFRSNVLSVKSFNHHQAIRDLIKFKKPGLTYFVAECDIMKFFDCAHHGMVRKAFYEFCDRASKEFSISVNQRAKDLFESYLQSFAFNIDIKQQERNLLSKIGAETGTIPWPVSKEFDRIGVNIKKDRIGVPQGGALSCLIANLLLHSVDRKVLSENTDEMFYARFCDDMVLICSDLKKCKCAFQRYLDGLQAVKLIGHEPIEFKSYDANFWSPKSKSKLPYMWGPKNSFNKDLLSVPWLSFVGYQIRYDNLIRIRKSSIQKELKKQVEEVDDIIKILKKSKRASIDRRAVVFRVQQRLISMAVGRIMTFKRRASMCWSAGFNVAKDYKNVKSQFIKLDRNRERQLNRLSRFVLRIDDQPRRAKKQIKRLKYYGKKFSYFHQFT
jgi:hypothetical protein